MRFTRSVVTTTAVAAVALGVTTALAAPATAAPNTTPQKVCGSAYKTVNSAAIGSLGTVYLTYNASNG
ncbi:spore-associated protein, partial [Streptomyces sp. NPDC000075]